jgi:hypothetical protein
MLRIYLVSTNRRFHTFLRGVHEVAEEHNSEHVISCSASGCGTTPPPSAKESSLFHACLPSFYN